MPAKAHRALARAAKKHGFKKGSKRWRRYVYGGLRNIGWKPRKRRKKRTTKRRKRHRRKK